MGCNGPRSPITPERVLLAKTGRAVRSEYLLQIRKDQNVLTNLFPFILKLFGDLFPACPAASVNISG